jgi:hypothetical protein
LTMKSEWRQSSARIGGGIGTSAILLRLQHVATEFLFACIVRKLTRPFIRRRALQIFKYVPANGSEFRRKPGEPEG